MLFRATLLIGIACCRAIAQEAPPESNPFYNELRAPWQLFKANKLDDAAAGFRSVLARAKEAGNRVGEAWSHDALGRIHQDRLEFPAARTEYEAALSLYEAANDTIDLASVASRLGRVSDSLGDKALARGYYRQALAIYERRGQLRDVARLLSYLENAGDPEGEALNRRGLEIGRQLGDKRIQAQMLHSMGDGLFLKGVFDEADERYRQAAALYQELEDDLGMSGVLTSEGRLQRAHGHPEKSIELYRQALALQRKHKNLLGAMQSINAIAVTYGILGDHRTAIEMYGQALAMAEETGSARYIDFEKANLAGEYMQDGRSGEAAAILEKILQNNPHIEWANLRWRSLAEAYFHLGRFRDASEAAGKSIELSRGNERYEALPNSLWTRARAREKAGDEGGALEDVEACLGALERLRSHLVPDDFMKRGFAEQNREAFEMTIRLLARAGNAAGAWEAAEQARSRAFLDLLASRGVRTLGERRTGDPEAGLSSHGVGAPASLAELQRTARRLHSTVVSYWVAQEVTYIWVAPSEGEIHAASVEITPKRLAGLANALWSEREGTARTAARELYGVLMVPVEQWLPAAPGSLLTIEPHGPLLMLSFAALRDARGRYLLERFRLHSVPAISLLELLEGKAGERTAWPRRFLLIADPANMPKGFDGQSLPPLPGARREVAAVARALPTAQVTTLERRQATEERLKAMAGESDVIHFATHGVIRDDQPFDSFLALSGSLPVSDGRLTAREIYGLDLRADLVFLSACRSGRGQVTGDGIAGLTRAFLYAGTASIIASLWDVADEPTYRLTDAFYRSWLAGKEKSEALRSAQLSLLRALRAGEVSVRTAGGNVPLREIPVFWAGFVLQGHP